MDAEPSPDVQLPYLQTFSKAAELTSFTGAAKVLGLTQAAVSQRIQSLEQSLDTSLFDRRGGRVSLIFSSGDPAALRNRRHMSYHALKFDADGTVTRGPARDALQHYAVTIAADGTLTVDGSQPVSGSTRTPVG